MAGARRRVTRLEWKFPSSPLAAAAAAAVPASSLVRVTARWCVLIAIAQGEEDTQKREEGPHVPKQSKTPPIENSKWALLLLTQPLNSAPFYPCQFSARVSLVSMDKLSFFRLMIRFRLLFEMGHLIWSLNLRMFTSQMHRTVEHVCLLRALSLSAMVE